MSAPLPGGMTADQLDEVYQFALDLGKKAGQMLLDGMHSRMTGSDAPHTGDANTSNNLAFTEKDNAVDIVTQVDEGQFSNDPDSIFLLNQVNRRGTIYPYSYPDEIPNTQVR